MNNSRNLSFELIQKTDLPFLEKLFGYEEVRRYYILSDEQSRDISFFLDYLINARNCSRSLVYKIFLVKQQIPIGIIGGETCLDFQKELAWNVSYAIMPDYWNNGYATEALLAFTEEIKKYQIPNAFLDISSKNTTSERVARKAGYTKNTIWAHWDGERTYLETLFHWEKKLRSKRDYYFSEAVNAYRRKEYREAEQLFMQALEEVYEGSPNTDALCYSNMGMACTSYGNYVKALNCLKKAQSLGLTNPSIEKELIWLKTHKGLE